MFTNTNAIEHGFSACHGKVCNVHVYWLSGQLRSPFRFFFFKLKFGA